MSHDDDGVGLSMVLRDLAEDGGRPLVPTEDILRAGRKAKRRRRAARAGSAVTACAALALGAVALPSVSLFGRPPAATATAATYLRGVADRIATSGDPGSSRWWKVEYEQSINGRKPVRVITWQGKRPKDDDSYYPDGPPTALVNPVMRDLATDSGYTRAELAHLPAEPAALRKVLLGKAAQYVGDGPPPAEYADPDTALMTEAGSLLVAPVASPVRRAVFQVMADSKLATLVGPVKDARGRSGTAVDFGANNDGTRFIFAEDGSLLETTTTYPAGTWFVQTVPTKYPAGKIRSTVLFQGGVDAVTAGRWPRRSGSSSLRRRR